MLVSVLCVYINVQIGNTVLLEPLLRSTTRFLQNKNRLYDLERRFMHFVSELMRQTSVREQLGIFQKMKTDLQEVAAMPGAKVLLQTFDLEAWLDSRISGRTFAAVVREKWRRENRP